MGKFSPRRTLSPSDMHSPRAQEPSSHNDIRAQIPQTPSRPVSHVRDTATSAIHGFTVLRDTLPQHLEIWRLSRLAKHQLERQWQRLRTSHFARDRIPNGLDMEFLHYGFPWERAYCQRLSTLKPPPNGYVNLSTELLCIPTPWVSGQWRENLSVNIHVKHPYPTSGDFTNPEDVTCALDNAHALWASSRRWVTGDPGRLLQEIRKEPLVANSHWLLVPWQQLKFHSLSAEARADLYVPAPTWWSKEGWVSSHVFVALPPIVTYRE
jgi:hypothetical protein